MFNKPRKIRHILVDSSLQATRVWLIFGSFIWCLLLAWPGTLFTPSRTTYHLMARVAPEEVWATLFFIQGVWAYYTLRTGVRNKVTLAMDAFLGCVLWSSSTILCFLAHWPVGYPSFFETLIHYPPPAAMSGELIITFASWWHLVRYWAEEEKFLENLANCASTDCEMKLKL